MFKRKPKTETTTQELIDDANRVLLTLDPESPEYDKILNQIERLHKLHSREKEGRRVSPDAVLGAAVTIGCIVIIVAYEHAFPVVSKALGFVPKN